MSTDNLHPNRRSSVPQSSCDLVGPFVAAIILNSVLLFGSAGLWAASRVVQPSPGGIDPRPLLFSITNRGDHLEIQGAGFQGGPFRVVYSTNVSGGPWTGVGPALTNRFFTVSLTNPGGTGFYRMSGAPPWYASAGIGGYACGQCHSTYNEASRPWDIWYDSWVQTPHARAFAALTNSNPANTTNASCLPCHTVGYGYPGGYTVGNQALEGVQCENCHGPGGLLHRSYVDRRPAVEWSAMVCGGCHNSPRYHTYDEWKSSRHSSMNPEVAGLFRDATNGYANQVACGSCHSGAMRAYLLIPAGGDVPDAIEAGREGIVCVGCHDPHQNSAAGHQLRNPLFSTNTYSVRLATNWNSFMAQYQPGVNLCGQCHNARGAAWTDTDSPPHASPQYNLLLGAIGELPGGAPPYQPGSHALLIQDQCVGCHMPATAVQGDGQPGISGHSFTVHSYDLCLACHPFPEPLAEFTVYAVSNKVQQVKNWLDYWALNKAPVSLRTNYGVRAWEFTQPGELSNPAGTTNAGPTSLEQALLPDNIRKARFNLYLVQRDGSFGIHNGPYAITLLQAAEDWIQAALRQ